MTNLNSKELPVGGDLPERLFVAWLEESGGVGPRVAKLLEEAAESTARSREALREIVRMRPAGDIDKAKNTRALVMKIEEIALAALTIQGEAK